MPIRHAPRLRLTLLKSLKYEKKPCSLAVVYVSWMNLPLCNERVGRLGRAHSLSRAQDAR